RPSPLPRTASASPRISLSLGPTTAKEIRSVVGPKDKLMRGVAFGDGGKVLATACSNHVVTLWDMATGNALDTINIGVQPYRLSMSDDGRVLAVTAEDEFARVYDVSAAIGK